MSAQVQPYVDWLELPPEIVRPNHYELLGIKVFESDERKIKGGYYRRVARVSIYQNGPTAETCTLVLTELAEARDCLVDPSARTTYDDRLRRKVGRKPDSPKRSGRLTSQSPNAVLATELDDRKSATPKRMDYQSSIIELFAGNASTAAGLAIRGNNLESTYQNASTENVHPELLALGVSTVPIDNHLDDLASLTTNERPSHPTSGTQLSQRGRRVTRNVGSATQQVTSYRTTSPTKARNQSQSSLQLWFAQYGILTVSFSAAILVVGGLMFHFGRSTVSSETVQPTETVKSTATAEPKQGVDGVPQVEAIEVFRIP